MTGVQVQCTLSEIVNNLGMQYFPNAIIFSLIGFYLCTLHLVRREKGGGWAKFWCSTMLQSALLEVMQNVSTWQEFTACFLSRLGWEVHNDIQLISKKELNAYSVLQQIDRKKNKIDKRCSVLGVSYLFLVGLKHESLWRNTSGERGVLLIPMPSSDGKRKWRRGSQYS